MLYWALVFLIVAIIAAVFGFAGVATAAAGIAKLLFYIFLVVRDHADHGTDAQRRNQRVGQDHALCIERAEQYCEAPKLTSGASPVLLKLDHHEALLMKYRKSLI